MAILVCCSCCSGAQRLLSHAFSYLMVLMNTELHITDQRLEPIAAKVLAGERLSAEDGLALYESSDLLATGWLANHVREKRHGNICYYNINRHINPTNVCGAHCKLCAFGRDKD